MLTCKQSSFDRGNTWFLSANSTESVPRSRCGVRSRACHNLVNPTSVESKKEREVLRWHADSYSGLDSGERANGASLLVEGCSEHARKSGYQGVIWFKTSIGNDPSKPWASSSDRKVPVHVLSGHALCPKKCWNVPSK